MRVSLPPSLIAALCSLLTSYAAPAMPNVLVFLVDDLGYMDIAVNNPDSFYATPNIDALAAS